MRFWDHDHQEVAKLPSVDDVKQTVEDKIESGEEKAEYRYIIQSAHYSVHYKTARGLATKASAYIKKLEEQLKHAESIAEDLAHQHDQLDAEGAMKKWNGYYDRWINI